MAQVLKLSKPQKWQIFTTTGLILIELLIYTSIGLTNGFNYANQVVTNNIPTVILLTAFSLAFFPSYSNLHDLWKKLVNQFTFSGTVLGLTSLLVYTYYVFNEPSTAVEKLTKQIASVFGVFSFLTTLGAQVYNNSKDGQ